MAETIGEQTTNSQNKICQKDNKNLWGRFVDIIIIISLSPAVYEKNSSMPKAIET